MIFHETELNGCVLIEPERRTDDRGFFARTFDAGEFRMRGLEDRVDQCSVSFNVRTGTLRGLHYQIAPHDEAKLVRCTRGRAFDVTVDLRPASTTFGRWTAFVLDADNRLSVYVPKGFAHGFVTLDDDTELTYAISTPFAPGSARGIRWDDPALSIAWPVDPEHLTISGRDRGWPLLKELET